MASAPPATATHPLSRRHAYWLVGAFAFGWLVISAGTMLINPLLPLVRAEFQLSGAETGLLTVAFTLPYLLMQIPSGMLADRLGARRVLVAMTLLSGLGMVALGLWSYALPALVAFAVVNRVGAGVYYPTAFGVTAGAVPARSRGMASAFLVMGMALGSALGLSLAVPLAGLAGNNWRFPLLAAGLLTLLLPALFQVLTWPAPRPRALSSGSIAAALRDRSLLALFAINCCSNYAFTALAVWGPAFISGERGLSLALAGFYVGLVNLIGFPAGLASGLLSDRLGRQRLTMLLFAAAGAALAALAAFGEPALVLVAMVAFGVAGKWSSDGVLAAWMGDHATARFPFLASAVYGVNNTARMLGALLAPLVSGALLDRTGTLATGFFVAAAVLGAASCLAPLVVEGQAAEGWLPGQAAAAEADRR